MFFSQKKLKRTSSSNVFYIKRGNELSGQAIKHSISYSDLLEIYVSSARWNVIIRNVLKILFFVITMGCFVIVVYIFCCSINYSFSIFERYSTSSDITWEVIVSVVTVLVPTISSLIVAFLKIPQIIAKYLFNIEEDNLMNSIIKNIQKYDKVMFAMEHDIEELLKKHKKLTEETEDEDIEESPKEKKEDRKSVV